MGFTQLIIFAILILSVAMAPQPPESGRVWVNPHTVYPASSNINRTSHSVTITSHEIDSLTGGFHKGVSWIGNIICSWNTGYEISPERCHQSCVDWYDDHGVICEGWTLGEADHHWCVIYSSVSGEEHQAGWISGENLCGNPDSYYITNMVYNIPAGIITPEGKASLKEQTCYNCDGVEHKCISILSRSVAKTTSYDLTTCLTIGSTAEFSGGIPIIAASKIEVSVTTSFQQTVGRSTTVTEEFTERAEYMMEAMHRGKAILGAKRGTITVPYEADAYCVKGGDTSYKGRISGIFEGVSFSETTIKFMAHEPVTKEDCGGVEGEVKIIAS